MCHQVEVVKMEEEIVSRKKRRGQTMTEYAIIVALIALACIGAIKVVGAQAADVFNKTGDILEDANDNVD